MTKTTGLALAIICVAAAAARAQRPARSGAFDLMMTHGQLKPPSGWAEAVAIRDGIIVAVGDTKTIEALRVRETQVLDLGGDTVLPGLHDSHVHALFAGLEQFACGFEPGASPRAIADAVEGCVFEFEGNEGRGGFRDDLSSVFSGLEQRTQRPVV